MPIVSTGSAGSSFLKSIARLQADPPPRRSSLRNLGELLLGRPGLDGPVAVDAPGAAGDDAATLHV